MPNNHPYDKKGDRRQQDLNDLVDGAVNFGLDISSTVLSGIAGALDSVGDSLNRAAQRPEQNSFIAYRRKLDNSLAGHYGGWMTMGVLGWVFGGCFAIAALVMAALAGVAPNDASLWSAMPVFNILAPTFTACTLGFFVMGYAGCHAANYFGRLRRYLRGMHGFTAELPELTPAQELAGYIRARSAAALITPHALLLEEVENADELLAQMPTDPQCTDIVTRAGAKDTYYYSNANMSDNYAMIAQLIEDKDLCVMFAEMVRFNARIYPSATPLKYFQRSPYGLAPEVIEQTWKAMQENPEYADIEELTNNQNERFLFSTKHLTRRYAKAISDVDDFCD